LSSCKTEGDPEAAAEPQILNRDDLASYHVGDAEKPIALHL
jgi:hypothetical protein